MTSIFDQDLDRNAANHAPLSPLSFIERTAEIYPHRLAVIHGDLRRTWSEVYTRCRQLASALSRHGIEKGDTVAVMLPNTPAMVEAHFGIPMSGAVLNALNTRLMDPATATTSMIGWITTDFLLGLSIVWAYAAMRPRFGPGAGTAAKAALLVWAVSHIAYGSFAFLDLFPANLVALVTAGGLVAALAGGYAGCSIYRE